MIESLKKINEIKKVIEKNNLLILEFDKLNILKIFTEIEI